MHKFTISSSYHRDDEENEEQNMTGVEGSCWMLSTCRNISMVWPLSPSSGGWSIQHSLTTFLLMILSTGRKKENPLMIPVAFWWPTSSHSSCICTMRGRWISAQYTIRSVGQEPSAKLFKRFYCVCTADACSWAGRLNIHVHIYKYYIDINWKLLQSHIVVKKPSWTRTFSLKDLTRFHLRSFFCIQSFHFVNCENCSVSTLLVIY